ncbi:MAG: Laminin G domain protein [candidate division WS6 bacterium OLB21]|uniref:Laminin G domain protein n=2 Tax=Candidatus Dojkabacteria TaxID=74243 RepID=A0A136KIQ9_9BACT|nr:MAG: Laminin G domain protein [candidate division WS6 bacterium OLB21]
MRIYRTALDKKTVEELYSFQPDAIAHWKLDEKEGTTANDSSLNNLHGTLQNMSGNEWQEGKISKSLRFDGTNDYVSVPDNDLLYVAAGGSFSIATWFKTDGTVSSDSLLVGKGGLGNSIGYSLYLDSTGKVVCGIDDDASSFPEDSVVSTAEYDDSEWHHALCVKDNSSISLYINGTSEGTPDTSLLATGSLYNSSPLTFAGNSAGLNFSGQMDDVRYWNYPITSTDFIEELAQPESSFISTLTQSTEKQTTQDLAVHYKLDSKSGVTAVDSSTNAANGTLNNTTDANWVRGKVGGAINLNGSDQYVSTADSSLFDWSNQITVSAWFKTSTAAQRSLVAKIAGANAYEFHLSVEADGRVRCWMSTNGTTPSTLAYSLTGQNYVNGQWNFATCVYNGSNIRVTVNGLPGTAVNFTGNIHNGAQPLTIGGNPSWGGSWMFNGSIDNVKIWKRALTVREIALEYNGGAPTGYWKFDEGSGTTAFDHSGNGLHATLLNTTPSTAWLAPTNCKYNGCHEFDGTNDYATTSTSAYLNPPQELTLSTWVKFTKTYVGAGNDLIFGKDFTSHTDPFYHYRLSSVGNYGPDPYRLGFFVKTSTVTVNRSCGTGANYWNSRVGEWMHLVGTYDAQGTLKFYIDGQLICSHTGGGLIANYNTGLNFAKYRNINVYVPVVLDETKHFTYALTEEDVKREFHSNGASLLFK